MTYVEARYLNVDRRILVATNETEYSKLAVVYAIHLAILSNAELTVAVVSADLRSIRDPALRSHDDEGAKRIANSAIEKARLAGVRVVHETVIVSRKADSAIVQYALATNAPAQKRDTIKILVGEILSSNMTRGA